MQEKQDPLSKFQWKDVRRDSSFLIVGNRACGKTYLVKSALFDLQDRFDAVLLFASPETMSLFDGIIPPNLMHCVTSMIDSLRDAVILAEHIITTIESFVPEHPELHILCILDDCACYDRKFISTLERILYNARHLKASLWITVNELMPKCATKQLFDYVFVMRTSNRKNLARYRTFFGFIEDDSTFVSAFDSATEHYGALVSDSIRSTAHTYHAPLSVPAFRTSVNFWHDTST